MSQTHRVALAAVTCGFEEAVAFKKAFERIGYFFTDPPELNGSVFIHVATLGETLSEAQRDICIQQVAQGSPAERREAIHALWGERSSAYLEALLKAIEQDSERAAAVAMRFVNEDPRVRSALVRLLERSPLTDICSIAQLVGEAGGDGALAALRRRLHAAVDATTWLGLAQGPNTAPEVIGALAYAVLRLDPDAMDAANHLLQASRSATGYARLSMVRNMAFISDTDLRTAAYHMLRKEIDDLLHSADIDTFLTAAPTLAREHGEAVHQRCAEILDAHWKRAASGTILALTKLPAPYRARSLATIVDWLLDVEPPADIALWAAGYVHEFLPRDFSSAILQEALDSASPTLRREATVYIEHLASDARNLDLLSVAASTEPDPLLQREMRRVLGRITPSPSAAG